MRPLLLDFPDDPVCWDIEDQYAFGRSLLVAPVVEEGATTRTLYLPHGEWVELWSGERMQGGRWLTVDAPLDRIPVFARSGSLIPLRFGAEGRFGEDTGNEASGMDGISFLLAGPTGEGIWTDSKGGAQRISFHTEDDGMISFNLPPLSVSARVLFPGGKPVTAEPGPGRQTVYLSPDRYMPSGLQVDCDA
jgi:hypothetical protein